MHLSKLLYRLSYSLGVFLFFYEVAWGALLLWALFFKVNTTTLSTVAFGGDSQSNAYVLGSLLWGALGGVVGGLYSLIKHISEDQDFDKQYALWYLAAPPIGMIVGAVVYMITGLGIFSITGGQKVSQPILIYVLAWIAGFQQNVFTAYG